MAQVEYDIEEAKIVKTVPYQVLGERPPVKPGKPKPVDPTQEELEARRREVLKSMDYDEGAAKDEVKPPPAKTPEEEEAERVAAEAKAVEEEAAAAKKAEEDARKAEEEAARAHNPTAEEREQALVDRTARATVAAVKELLPKPAETPKREAVAPEIAALSQEDRSDLEAVEYLEQNKRVPAGMKAQMLAFYQRCRAYQEEWQKAHPDDEYNPEDKEHAEKITGWTPDVAVELLDEAREELRVEKLVEKRLKPIEQERETERRNAEVVQTLEKAKPQIHRSFLASMAELIDQVAPAVLEMLKGKDGKLDLSDESVAKVEKADPIAKEVLDDIIGRQLHPVVVELEKSVVLGPKFVWDWRNPLHARILDEIAECEKVLTDAPANVRIQNGREFMTVIAYTGKQQEILNGTGTEGEKQAALSKLDRTCWRLTTDDVCESFVDKIAREAEKRIADTDELVKKASGKEPPVRSKRPQKLATAGTKTATEAAPASGKHRAPTLTGQDDRLPTPGHVPPKPDSFGENVMKTHFR